MKQLSAAIPFLFLSLSCFPSISSITSDGLSLLSLKAGISSDPNHALISWSDSDKTPCRWVGITCDASRRNVISLSLSGKNLSGYIASEIGALEFLSSLDLSNNSFSGPLPHQITSLGNLIHLDVSSNNFNGSIPENLSNLTLLSGTLNLSYNAFSGAIPASFGNFPVMISLDLRHNNLTGKIPQVGSLLNQGPTAFSGNPYLCGFPLSNPCEAQNPNLSNNPQKPQNVEIPPNVFVHNRNIRTGLTTIALISGVCLTIVLILVAVVVIRLQRRKRKEGKTRKEEESWAEGSAAAVGGSDEGQKGKFVVVEEGFGVELEDLLRASAYVLGKSRSGIVYKVVVGGGIPAVVAVRRLSEGDGDATWRLREFEAEVEAMNRVQHSNVVRLKGYYYAADEKLLISEFIRNGSLYNALHGPVNKLPPLSWAVRLRIVREAAHGLTHIHECSHRKYVHADIRSSKILLDEDFKPYISGFGLSRLVPKSVSNKQMAGVCHKSLSYYLAPEVQGSLSSCKLSQKCDVYAFGVVILEILTGRLPDDGAEEDNSMGLVGFVRNVFRQGRPLSEIIDPSLLHEVHAKKQVVAVFHVALSCTEMDPELRPRMRIISDNLDCIELQ